MRLIATATELLALGEEHRIPPYRASALICVGWALAQTGEVTEGKQRLAEGVGAWSTLGARAWLPCGLCVLAEAYLLGRQYADGLEHVAQALAVAAEIGEQWYVPRLHHLRAELLQAQSRHSDAAEASLRTAVDIARAQGARGWELRAATSLARGKVGKLSTPSDAGKVRDRIGAFAGLSGRTVDKITQVVEAAEREPEKYGPLLKEMDRTGKVDGAYRKFQQKKDEAKRLALKPLSGKFRTIVWIRLGITKDCLSLAAGAPSMR